MVHHPRWSLTREAAVALLVSSAFSASALAAEVARVQFARGQVNATDKDGRVRPLARGARLNVGDTVNTEQGRAQLKFADGARVSLQPRSAFRIDEFQFRGRADGSEKGFFSLLRGGLRAITGLIGRTNRDTYRVNTLTATIGIRGTEYIAEVVDSLRVTVGGGSISIRNDAGTFVVEQGQTAYVADRNSLPVIEFDKPVLAPRGTEEGLGPPPVLPEPPVVAGEQPGAVTPGEPIAPDIGTFAIDGESALYLTTGKATVSGDQLTAFNDPSPPGSGQAFSKGTTTVEDASYDGTVGVARWSNGTLSATVEGEDGLETRAITVGANQGLHAAFGTPTPTMPTTMTATYGLLAATQATSSDGSLGLGMFSPGQGAGQPILAVDFGSGRVGIDFKVTFDDQAYRVTTSGGLYNLGGSEITLLGATAPGVFANTLSVPTFGIAGNACASGCTDTDVLGFFAGDGASRTGFTYRITDADVTVNGAAAGGPASVTASLVAPEPHVASFTIDGDDGPTTKRGIATTEDGGRLTAFDVPASDQWYDKGTATVEDASHDGTVGVARWSGGEGSGTLLVATSAPRQVVVGPNQGLHAAFGTPTSVMPTTMTATYGLLASTKVTSSDGSLGLGTVAPAQGTGKPILSVDFASGRVGTDFKVTFTDQAYRVTTSGGLYNVGGSEITLVGGVFGNTSSVPTFGIAGNACASGCVDTEVLGFFAGDGASRTGFTYRIADGAVALNGAVAAGPASVTASLVAPEPQVASFTIDGDDGPTTKRGIANLEGGDTLTAFDVPASDQWYDKGTTTVADASHDGTVGVARWSDGTLLVATSAPRQVVVGPNQGLHAAFGTPTSVMPTTMAATYGLLAATQATSSDGSLGLGTVASAQGAGEPILSVDFASGRVGTDFTVTFPTATYRVTSSGGLYNVAGSEIALVGGAAPGVYSNTALVPTFGIAGVACVSGCAGTDVHGFFAGDAASRTGFTYRIADGAIAVNGAVAAGPAATTAVLATDVTPISAAFAAWQSAAAGNVESYEAHVGTGTATLNPANHLLAFSGTNDYCCVAGTVTMAQGTATYAEAGYDGVIGFGRLANGTANIDGGEGNGVKNLTLSTAQGLHHAFGSPTPSADLASLAASGMPTATYSLIGATNATASDGSLGLGTVAPAQGTGQPILSADFASGRIGLDFTVTFPDAGPEQAYRVTTNGGLYNVGSSEISMINRATSASFQGDRIGTTKDGAPCEFSCDTDVRGFFAGMNASRAGFSYRIREDIDDGGSLLGVYGAVNAGPANRMPALLNSVTSAAVFSGSGDRYAPDLFGGEGSGTAGLDVSGRLVSYLGTYLTSNFNCCAFGDGTVSSDQQSATFAEAGYDGTVGYGRLSSGTVAVDGGEGAGTTTLSSTQGFHYGFGTLTPTMPTIAAIANYSLLGATKATSDDGSLGLGTFSGSLAIDLISQRVGTDFSVAFPSVTYRVTTTGGVTSVLTSEMRLDAGSSTFSTGRFGAPSPNTWKNGAPCASDCSSSLFGFFAGNNAERGALAYRIYDDVDSGHNVSGAAAFTQSGQTPHVTDIPLNFAGAHDNIVVPSNLSDSFRHLDTTGTVDATTRALIAINEGGNTNIGTARVAEYGGDSTIGWTRWAEGTLAGSGTHANSVLSSNRSFHGAYGPPTPAADLAALAGANVTAAYSLIGGTSPTDATGVSAPGTLNSGSLTARFGVAQVDVNLNVTAAAVTYDVNATNLPIAGSGFGGMTNNVDCSGCMANIQGFFAGAMAARAGVAYTISNGGGPLANGAAGFTKTVP